MSDRIPNYGSLYPEVRRALTVIQNDYQNQLDILVAQVGAIGDLVTYEPNARNAGRADISRTVAHASYSVVGGFCHAVADIDITSNSAGSGAIRIDLPVAGATSGLMIGTMQFFDASGGLVYKAAAVIPTGVSSIQVEGYRDNSSAAMASTLQTGDAIRIAVSYPIG